jgi:hypothetical protein
MVQVIRCHVAIGLLCASGCATWANVQQLRTRAAFDFGCRESELQVVELDARTRGVKGCGRRATYVETCKPCANGYQDCECTWLLNTDATRVETTPRL